MQSEIGKTNNMAIIYCHRAYVAFDGVIDVLFYFLYITFIHNSSQINFETFPLFLSLCLSYLLQQFSIHMIHGKLHSLRCGTRDITFICYGYCKPRPSEIPDLECIQQVNLTLLSTNMTGFNSIRILHRCCGTLMLKKQSVNIFQIFNKLASDGFQMSPAYAYPQGIILT